MKWFGAVAFFACASCSLLTDFGSLNGGATGDASVDDSSAEAGGMDAAPKPPDSCKTDGFACVAEAPSGWSGPFELFDGLASSAPSCGGTFPVIALSSNADLVPAAPATCPACTCTASGAKCGSIDVDGNNGGCSACNSNNTKLNPGQCASYTYGTILCGAYNANGLRFSGPSTVISGTCAPDFAKPTAMKSAIVFNRLEIGCQGAIARVDCDAGYVCAGVAKPPFSKGLCVLQKGDFPACPGAPYSQRFLFNQNANDTRDCGACACGGKPDPLACNATVTTSTSDWTCGTGTTVGVPGCSGDYPGYAKLTATPPAKTTCPASGGAPVGTVTASDPVTVCCIP